MDDNIDLPDVDVPGDDTDENPLEQSVGLDSDEIGERAGDDGWDPPERAGAVNRFGTTLQEQQDGESLDQLLAEEEPDVDPYAEAERTERGSVLESDVADTHVARPGDPFDGAGDDTGAAVTPLVEDDEGVRSDTTPELVGREGGGWIDGESAEEAAVHVDTME